MLPGINPPEVHSQARADDGTIGLYLAGLLSTTRLSGALPPCSQNEIGIKAPSKATVVTERRSRMQAFSNSFNNIKYRDQVSQEEQPAIPSSPRLSRHPC